MVRLLLVLQRSTPPLSPSYLRLVEHSCAPLFALTLVMERVSAVTIQSSILDPDNATNLALEREIKYPREQSTTYVRRLEEQKRVHERESTSFNLLQTSLASEQKENHQLHYHIGRLQTSARNIDRSPTPNPIVYVRKQGPAKAPGGPLLVAAVQERLKSIEFSHLMLALQAEQRTLATLKSDLAEARKEVKILASRLSKTQAVLTIVQDRVSDSYRYVQPHRATRQRIRDADILALTTFLCTFTLLLIVTRLVFWLAAAKCPALDFEKHSLALVLFLLSALTFELLVRFQDVRLHLRKIVLQGVAVPTQQHPPA